MARFNALLLLVAALACLACTQARDLLQTTQTCTVLASAKSYSQNQITCKFNYGEIIKNVVTHYCTNPSLPVPSEVKLIINEKITTIASATATAMVRLSYTGTISSACDPGSALKFDGRARAKAMARAVSQSYISAALQVLGAEAFSGVDAEIAAQATAIASTCETKFYEISKLHVCTKTACTLSTCPFTCDYANTQLVTAVTEAIAEIELELEALVETFVNTDCSGSDCVDLCGYVCADGC